VSRVLLEFIAFFLSPFIRLLAMPHFTFAIALSTLMAAYALRKKSLSKDGAAGAFILGLATFSSNYWLFTIVLLVFFFSSSRLTKASHSLNVLFFPQFE
jgi:uncharacterized membrane protein